MSALTQPDVRFVTIRCRCWCWCWCRWHRVDERNKANSNNSLMMTTQPSPHQWPADEVGLRSRFRKGAAVSHQWPAGDPVSQLIYSRKLGCDLGRTTSLSCNILSMAGPYPVGSFTTPEIHYKLLAYIGEAQSTLFKWMVKFAFSFSL